MSRLTVLALLSLLPALCSCASAVPPADQAPVSSAEAAATLRQVAALAAGRTQAAADRVCDTLADSCDGLSGVLRTDPASAPLTPPTVLCDIALPRLPGQAGARVLVVTGKDAAGQDYVGQVLVLRRDGRPVLHEPAFWQGIRYTQLTGGRAWGGGGNDPAQRAAHDVAVRRACQDPAAFVAAVVPPAARSS